MINSKTLIDNEKEDERIDLSLHLDLQLPTLDESAASLRFALPRTQITNFINRLTIQEARQVGPKINAAILAANFVRLHGSEDGIGRKNLALIGQLAREHSNKRYKIVMGAVRDVCESEDPDLHAAIWTLLAARNLLLEANPGWQKGLDLYAGRLGLPLVRA